MTRRRIAWEDGEERIQRWIESWATGDTTIASEILHKNDRRTLYRLESSRELSIDASGAATVRSVLVKIHRTHSGRHRAREAVKRRIGYSPALREWRALVELHALGVAVPEPLAWGFEPQGDPFLVTEFVPGRSLSSVLTSASPTERIVWIDRVSEAVARMHAAGYRHGDLHLGNLHAHDDEIVILDVQRAHRIRHAREPLRDLAHLDFSIARDGFDVALRERLRLRLGNPPGFDLASRRFVRDFLRGRSRRELRLGRAWSRWRPRAFQGLAGVLETGADRSALERALRESIADPRPGDRRGGRTRISIHTGKPESLVIKRTTQDSRLRVLIDRFRGGVAMRDFRRGQRLALLGRLGTKPLAALEERRSEGPHTSWLFLEHVGSIDLDCYQPRSEEEARRCCVALAAWIADWHVWGIDHMDLKAGNIRIDDRNDAFRFWLIDVGDIRFRRRLHDAARLRALVQLNASLSDDTFSIEARKLGLDHYCERLPFETMNDGDLIETLVERSLARNHRWRAVGHGMDRAARGDSMRS